MQKERLQMIGGLLLLLFVASSMAKAQSPNHKNLSDQPVTNKLLSARKVVDKLIKFQNLQTKPKTVRSGQTKNQSIAKKIALFSNKNLLSQTETKVKFQSGQSALNHQNEKHLELMTQQIWKKVQQLKRQFSAKNIRLLIEVKGFADAKPFYPGQTKNERTRLNKALARKRADAVMYYLKKQTNQKMYLFDYQVVACGEEIPRGLLKPKAIDAERRICEVSCCLYQTDKTPIQPNLLTSNQTASTQNQADPNNTHTYTSANPFTNSKAHQEIKLGTHLQVLEEVYWFSHKGYISQTETKVRFRSGSAQLSNWNEEHLEHLLIQIKESINSHRLHFPDEKVNLLIEVKGFTDEKPFYPNQPLSIRKKQNKALAQNRSDMVLGYIKSHIERYVDTFEYATLAYGEDIPYWHKAPEVVDPERRICEVYCLLYNGNRSSPLKIRVQ